MKTSVRIKRYDSSRTYLDNGTNAVAYEIVGCDVKTDDIESARRIVHGFSTDFFGPGGQLVGTDAGAESVTVWLDYAVRRSVVEAFVISLAERFGAR